MDNRSGQLTIEYLKTVGFEVDWDWGEENHACMSKEEGDSIITVEIMANPKEVKHEG